MATVPTVRLTTATVTADTITAMTTITAVSSVETAAAGVWTKAESVRNGGSHGETQA